MVINGGKDRLVHTIFSLFASLRDGVDPASYVATPFLVTTLGIVHRRIGDRQSIGRMRYWAHNQAILYRLALMTKHVGLGEKRREREDCQ